MRIHIGGDHAAYDLHQTLLTHLREAGCLSGAASNSLSLRVAPRQARGPTTGIPTSGWLKRFLS